MGNVIYTPFTEKELIPREEQLEVIKKGNVLSIGIPKENFVNERRVVLTPDAVKILVENGYKIFVERRAGEGAFFSDLEYSEAGALIVDRTQVWEQELILKINAPDEEEIDLLKPNAYLVSFLQIDLRKQEYFKKLSEKRINAIAFELIEDEKEERSLIRLIEEIAGRISVLYASELLANSKGLMLGGIIGVRPTEVVVLGAGGSGEYAVKTAMGLGATVRVFDNSLYELRSLKDKINSPIVTSMIDPKELSKSLRRADVIIGVLHRDNQAPIVTEDMVRLMKKGSVVVDLSVGMGKCVETTELTGFERPFVEKYGVLHCGLPNITSKMARTTSKAISNFFLSYLLENQEEGGFESLLMRKKGMKKSFYMYKGKHTQFMVCEKFNLRFTDINLLIF